MKKQVTQTLVILALIFVAIACKNEKKTENTVEETTQEALTYNGIKTFNLAESSIIWKGFKLFGNHSGNIQLKQGELTFDNGEVTGGNFIADMNSIKATELMQDDDEEEEEEEGEDGEEGEGHDDRDDLANHLKDGDFFDTKTYPESKFIITKVTKQSNQYNIKGNMTLKGKTNEIEFPAQITDDYFKATVKIDRTKFGIKYGSGSFFDNLGDNVIKDEFELVISLKLKN